MAAWQPMRTTWAAAPIKKGALNGSRDALRDEVRFFRQDELDFGIARGSRRLEPARVAGRVRLRRGAGICPVTATVTCDAVSVQLFRHGRRIGVRDVAVLRLRVFALRERRDAGRASDA